MPRAKGSLSRRAFVKDTGTLLVGFSLIDATILPRALEAVGQPARLVGTGPGRLDSWVRIEPDGGVRVFSGKADVGMGLPTALAQIVAEELDVTVERVTVVLGDSATTPDQGGVGGSQSIFQGAKALRNASATARALLLARASRRLATSPEQLDIRSGVVSTRDNPARRVTYAELVAGDPLNETLAVTGQGVTMDVHGTGVPKSPGLYSVVGTSVPRLDLPAKLFGTFPFVTSLTRDGMLHGRVVRPTGAGVSLVKVDDTAAKAVPGFVRTVIKGNFVGVVATTEWGAIKAARAIKATWSEPTNAFPEESTLYQFMRTATPKLTKDIANVGDAPAALAQATKRVEATYEFPFQAHATMDPGCAVAEVGADQVTVWCGAQKMHQLQRGLAELLGVAVEKVRVVWVADSGSYGRCGFEDVAGDAALLSQAVGKPVRVQWSRADMNTWGGRAPAVVCDLVAGLNAAGEATSLQFTSRAFSAQEVHALPSTAGNLLPGQLAGIPNAARGDEFAEWGTMSLPYRFQHLKATGHLLAVLGGERASPLRGAHLRDPNGPEVSFAVESFMDEIAAAVGMDPIEFRLKHLDDARASGVLRAAAERHWDRRPSPKNAPAGGGLASGRGIAVGTRRETYVATVADVEVDLRTGVVRVTRLTCFHDCGLMVNPNAVRGAVTAGLIQSMSRSLREELHFDRNTTTGADWIKYPVARSTDIPDIEVVLIERRDLPPGGVGEAQTRPTAAAIANAIFDATGARVRRVPFTPERVKEALAHA